MTINPQRNVNSTLMYNSLFPNINDSPPCHHEKLDELTVNITNDCNMYCEYCFVKKEKNSSRSINLVLESINKMFSQYNSIETIKFFGGEPLLHYLNISEIIENLIHEKRNSHIPNLPHFHINTNGTIYNSSIEDMLKKYNITLTVSIDGPQVVHDQIRIFKNGEGTFEKVIENTKRMNKNINQPRTIECVYHPCHIIHNFSIVDVVKYIKGIFPNANVIIHPVMEIDKSFRNFWDKNLYNTYKNSLYELSLEYGKHLISNAIIDNDFQSIEDILLDWKVRTLEYKICYAGIERWSIGPNGDIYPCYMMIGDKKWRIPYDLDFNLNEGLPERLLYINYKKAKSLCQKCQIFNTCYDCLGIDFKTIDNTPYCNFRKGLIEGVLSEISKLLEFENIKEKVSIL